jgi:hypothetical protein
VQHCARPAGILVRYALLVSTVMPVNRGLFDMARNLADLRLSDMRSNIRGDRRIVGAHSRRASCDRGGEQPDR